MSLCDMSDMEDLLVREFLMFLQVITIKTFILKTSIIGSFHLLNFKFNIDHASHAISFV